MRAFWWIPVAFLASSALSINTSPFLPPRDNEVLRKKAFDVLQILKRANNCPSGYSSCSNEGNSGACCISGTTCTRDAANNIACCPSGATCTGTLGGSATTEMGSSFMFPQTTTATTTTTTVGGNNAVATGSTITGAAYPFVVIPTTFSNAALCTSYYSLCQSEYTSCSSSLAGGFAVTIGGASGTTVYGATITSAAQSICSSLSLNACHGLQLGNCAAYGSSGAAVTAINKGPQARLSSIWDLAMGAAVGLAGMFM